MRSEKSTGFKLDLRKNAMFIALLAITVLFEITTHRVLLKPMNVSNIVLQNSYVLILAVGMLPCILTGNIDLSVGSVLGFISALAGTFIISKELPIWLAVIICLVAGAVIGAWHGFWIAYVRVPSFIVTLAGMLIFRGLTMVILDGNTLSPFPKEYQFISAGFLPSAFKIGKLHGLTIIIGIILSILAVISEFYRRKQQQEYGLDVPSTNIFIIQQIGVVIVINLFTYWLARFKGLPIVLILLTILVVFYSFITNKTIIGRHIYALGGNERATQLSGVNTNWVLFLTYVNMGIQAAVAGLVYSGRLNAAAPGAGNGFELDAIAACYIGGASATGGIGTVIGAIVGGLVMGILNNGMSIMGVGIDWQQAIKGMVLLLAVAFDIYNQKKKA